MSLWMMVHFESSMSKLANEVSKSLGCASPLAPMGPRSSSSQRLPKISLTYPWTGPSGRETLHLRPAWITQISPGRTIIRPSSVWISQTASLRYNQHIAVIVYKGLIGHIRICSIHMYRDTFFLRGIAMSTHCLQTLYESHLLVI